MLFVVRAVEQKLDLVDWHVVPPLSNLLAFWRKGGLAKNIACASLSESPVGWVDWLSGPTLEVTPYF